eukprot:scaffold1827_cov421-Prasinococcus_capsulatus_cf.AAC.25
MGGARPWAPVGGRRDCLGESLHDSHVRYSRRSPSNGKVSLFVHIGACCRQEGTPGCPPALPPLSLCPGRQRSPPRGPPPPWRVRRDCTLTRAHSFRAPHRVLRGQGQMAPSSMPPLRRRAHARAPGGRARSHGLRAACHGTPARHLHDHHR